MSTKKAPPPASVAEDDKRLLAEMLAKAPVSEDEPPPEPTVTVQPYVPREMPGFLMVDDPEELPPTAPLAPPPQSAPATIGRPSPAEAIEKGFSKPPGNVRYTSRIEVVEAYQYPGNVGGAPDWVDRSWMGWADTDMAKGLQAGPALRVPSDAGEVLARAGDYIVRQRVSGESSERERIEVWARAEFERIFMPVSAAMASLPSGVTSSLPPIPAASPSSAAAA